MSHAIVDLLSRLIAIPSHSNTPPYETEMADLLEEYLSAVGFRTQRQIIQHRRHGNNTYIRCNILAEKGTGNQSLLFYGHMDTAESARQHEAYTQEHKFYGPGAYAMKAGIAALLKAITEVEPVGYKLKVAFLVDEMQQALGMFQFIQSEWAKDVVIAVTPTRLTPEILVLGPQTYNACRHISIQITLYRTSMSSDPLQRGAQVVDALEAAIQEGSLSATFDGEAGGGVVSIRSFVSHAQPHAIPDSAIILVDRYLLPHETSKQACREIIDVLQQRFAAQEIGYLARNGYEVQVVKRIHPYLVPYLELSTHPFVAALKMVIDYHYGQLTETAPSHALSRVFLGTPLELGGLGIPVIALAPEGANTYPDQEWVSLQSLETLTDIYHFIGQHFTKMMLLIR